MDHPRGRRLKLAGPLKKKTKEKQFNIFIFCFFFYIFYIWEKSEKRFHRNVLERKLNLIVNRSNFRELKISISIDISRYYIIRKPSASQNNLPQKFADWGEIPQIHPHTIDFYRFIPSLHSRILTYTRIWAEFYNSDDRKYSLNPFSQYFWQ